MNAWKQLCAYSEIIFVFTRLAFKRVNITQGDLTALAIFWWSLPFLLSFYPPSLLPSLPSSLPPSLLPSLLPSLPPSFLSSFLPSFLPFFLPSFPPSLLPSLPPSFLPSFLLSSLPSFLPPSLPPSFLPLGFVQSLEKYGNLNTSFSDLEKIWKTKFSSGKVRNFLSKLPSR